MAKKGQPPAQYAPIQISDDDFIDGAIELGHRLSRHMNALENGEPGAVSDVAAVLRTLMVRGEGDDVIRRLCKRKGLSLPTVFVSRAAYDGPSVILSAGGIPGIPEDEDHPHQIPCHMADLDKWSEMIALVVQGGTPKRANDWNHVISMYANTFGSHMSSTIPKTLVETSSIMSGALDLGEYMIFCAGIAAETMLNQVLDEIAGKLIIVPHKIIRKPNPMAHLTLREAQPGYIDPTLELAFMPRGVEIGDDGIDVLKLHFNNRYMKYRYAREASGQIFGQVHHSIEKPDWW